MSALNLLPPIQLQAALDNGGFAWLDVAARPSGLNDGDRVELFGEPGWFWTDEAPWWRAIGWRPADDGLRVLCHCCEQLPAELDEDGDAVCRACMGEMVS